MMRMLIIGAGRAARHHAEAVAGVRETQLVGACDANAATARAFAAEYQVPGFVDLRTACTEARPHFAVVCTPPSTHAAATVAALRAGLHVLVEKPLVTDPDDITRITEAAARSGLIVGAVAQHRFAPDAVRLQQRIRRGEIGPLRTAAVRVARHRPPAYFGAAGSSWRCNPSIAGGGVLISVGIHYLDLLCWMLGSAHDPCVSSFNATDGIENFCHATFKIGAVRCTIDARWGEVPPMPDSLRLSTDDSTIELCEDRLHGGTSETNSRPSLHAAQLADFVGALRDAKLPTVAPLDVEPGLRLIFNLYSAARAMGVPRRTTDR